MATVFVLSLSGGAFAIPSLQVYIPGGSYDVATETWVTNASSFTVWVVASEPMTGVQLTASIGDGEDPFGGSLDIGGTSYTGSDFTFGHHPTLPDHGVFPAHWVDHSVGDMTTMTANTIADFNEFFEEGVTPLNSSGQIMLFNIAVSGFRQVHFDAWGFTSTGAFRKAPFSHDGGAAVPEPGTLALFGLGVGAVGWRRRRKSRKSRTV